MGRWGWSQTGPEGEKWDAGDGARQDLRGRGGTLGMELDRT